IEFDCLRSTRDGGADPKKLHVAHPTRVRIVSRGWRDQGWDTGAARVGDLGATVNILIIEVLSFHLHVPGEPDLRGYALFDGDLPGNVAVDNNLCISVRERGPAGVTILYRHVTGER